MMPSISDAFRQLVTDTENALITDDTVNFGIPKKLYFMHGNLKEITTQLEGLSKSPAHKNKKFPLIALFRDIKESLSDGQFGIDTTFNCKFAIFTLTEATYDSNQREEKNFKLILRPVLSEIINQIRQSVVFGMPTLESLKLEKWDCFFYGTTKDDKNSLNDYVDAIEVSNISLKIKTDC